MDARKYATYLAVVISPAVVGLLAESLGIDEVSAMNKYFTSKAYAAMTSTPSGTTKTPIPLLPPPVAR